MFESKLDDIAKCLIISFLAGTSSFEFMIDERIRVGDGWTFKSTIEVYLAITVSCYVVQII